MSYRPHTNCRVCQSDKLTSYLDLGNLPLSNNLCSSSDEVANTYPLKVMLCENCGLSQLSVVVNPELLFGHYVYRSSISKDYTNHCNKMAVELKERYGLDENSFVIDIAGNDGCLLKEFVDVIGCRVLNVDPAKNLYQICEDKGVRMFCTFWGMAASKHILENGVWPKADLITATNVFAHVSDINEFLLAAKYTLKEDGVLILEFPYLIDFIEKGEFDTIYAEHLSYFMISPLNMLCTEIGLNVMKVEKQDIHGGTVRVHIGYRQPDETVKQFIGSEQKYKSIEPYNHFAQVAKSTINLVYSQINYLKNKGYKVAGFACSAKGNTLLNCAGITNEQMDYIIDQTPEKIGKYSPGTHIPVLPLPALTTLPPDYLVILSWNFVDEIVNKCRGEGYVGKFIIPIPDFKIID